MAYESEFTRFMRAWLAAHPEVKAVQHSGRALWWDRGAQAVEATRRIEARTRVPPKPYAYDADFDPARARR
ncbi:MAG: DUF3460 family protein [Rhodocyclaceae bacterium]|nr:DUF3460 family protein [Rhodocyclaceae bacterium]